MALPKKYRLTAQTDFKLLFRQGKTVKNSFLFIRFLKNNLGFIRIGIVVPVKIEKKVVLRNRIRRLISESLKKFNFKSHSLDIAVIAGSGTIVEKSFQEIKSEIDKTINKVISQ